MPVRLTSQFKYCARLIGVASLQRRTVDVAGRIQHDVAVGILAVAASLEVVQSDFFASAVRPADDLVDRAIADTTELSGAVNVARSVQRQTGKWAAVAVCAGEVVDNSGSPALG